MKYSKTGILKKKISPASEVLQEEAKRMEEKLSELKQFMVKEKEKRDNAPRMKDGSKWRSAATSKPITGYADTVLAQKAKVTKQVKPENNEKPAENPEKNNEIFNFLANCGLDKYHKVFLDNGIDDLEILMELTEAHLSNLNIPLGHRLKILKNIKERKGKENEAQVVPQKIEKTETETGHEELVSAEMYKEVIDIYKNSGSSTLHKPKPKTQEDQPKKVRFLDPVTEDMLPKNLKSLLTEESEPLSKSVSQTFEESSSTSASVLIKHKKICYNCYKVFEAASMSQFMDKEFCSKTCRELYVESRSLTCVCHIKFIKDQGVLESGIWVCSEDCAQKVAAEELEQNNEDSEESSDSIKIDPSTGDVIKS